MPRINLLDNYSDNSPGEISSGMLSISTTNDATVEPNESFKITATVTSENTSNAITDLDVTIIDNDLIPTLTIDPSPGLEGVYTSTVTIRLSNPCSTPIEIHFTTTPGTAAQQIILVIWFRNPSLCILGKPGLVFLFQ